MTGRKQPGVARYRQVAQDLIARVDRSELAPGERLSDLARRTLYAASLLEKDLALTGKIKFATNELLFRVNDRLAAPNSDATFAALKPELEAAMDHPRRIRNETDRPKNLKCPFYKLCAESYKPLPSIIQTLATASH